MALIKCTECGKMFSDKAEACPDCGCPTSAIKNSDAKPRPIKHFDDVFQANGAEKLLNKGAIKAARNQILDSENVFYASVFNISTVPVTGAIPDKLTLKDKISGVLVITDKRVLFSHSTMGTGNTKQINISDITSVDSQKGVQICNVRIVGLTEMFVIDCGRKVADEILNVLAQVR